LRFALFTDNRWRREERALKTFPRAVILKRLATDLRVLLRAMGFGISAKDNCRRRDNKFFVVGLAFHRMEPAETEQHRQEARQGE
jgi:hypothetical protein